MKKYSILLWTMAILVWVFMLVLLIIALTDHAPTNPFREYPEVIGLGFLLASGFMRFVYNRTKH